jgi:hypothetical protein
LERLHEIIDSRIMLAEADVFCVRHRQMPFGRPARHCEHATIDNFPRRKNF